MPPGGRRGSIAVVLVAVVFVPLLDPDFFVPDADVPDADADADADAESETDAEAEAETDSDAAAVVAAASSVDAAAVSAAVSDAFCSCLRRISALESVSEGPGQGHADVKARKMKRVESKEKRPEPFILMESARAESNLGYWFDRGFGRKYWRRLVRQQ
jgi:hypothetical protein